MVKEQNLRYRLRHPGQDRAHYLANREKILATAKTSWRKRYEKNPQYFLVRAQLQHAKRKARPGTLTAEQWEAIKAAFKFRCAYCKKHPKRLSIDHVLPLAKGGTNNPQNIVPACLSCDRKKGAKLWTVQLAAAI
jgi:5-methylcytosine-specific restriction endonuclease McrA